MALKESRISIWANINRQARPSGGVSQKPKPRDTQRGSRRMQALQAYLGHRNIQKTTRYTALAPDRFKGF